MFDNGGWNGWNANGGNNGFFGGMPYSRQAPHYEIVKVNGEAGAKAFQMAPNSSLFLADATNPNIIWLVQTDGAGYLTPTPLDVSLHQEQPQPSISSLEERIKHLEDVYEQFNSGFGKQQKKQRQQSQQQSNATDQSANTAN